MFSTLFFSNIVYLRPPIFQSWQFCLETSFCNTTKAKKKNITRKQVFHLEVLKTKNKKKRNKKWCIERDGWGFARRCGLGHTRGRGVTVFSINVSNGFRKKKKKEIENLLRVWW